jgi:hypothetical protein
MNREVEKIRERLKYRRAVRWVIPEVLFFSAMIALMLYATYVSGG